MMLRGRLLSPFEQGDVGSFDSLEALEEAIRELHAPFAGRNRDRSIGSGDLFVRAPAIKS